MRGSTKQSRKEKTKKKKKKTRDGKEEEKGVGEERGIPRNLKNHDRATIRKREAKKRSNLIAQHKGSLSGNPPEEGKWSIRQKRVTNWVSSVHEHTGTQKKELQCIK